MDRLTLIVSSDHVITIPVDDISLYKDVTVIRHNDMYYTRLSAPYLGDHVFVRGVFASLN